ncbi:MAG: NAD-dependent protein deacetylase [Promethearchaeota archaeon]
MVKLRKRKKAGAGEVPAVDWEQVRPESREAIRRVAELLVGAKHCVVLTGAGMSTESGIPDFRSPKTGLWAKFQPSVAELETFLTNPLAFWKMAKKVAPTLFSAKPNAGHVVLAKLEDEGLVRAIITQNVDGLHQKAGSLFVFEVHGNVEEMSCVGCGATYGVDQVLRKVKKEKQIPPLCDICSAPLKPNVVLFGEALPRATLYESIAQSERADLFLVCGSSLEVSPANTFPVYCLNKGGRLAIFNVEPTHLDYKAVATVREKLGASLPLLYRAVHEILDGKDQ